MSSQADTQESVASAVGVSRLRVTLNRFIFRAVLFTVGTIAVVMYYVVPSKRLTWRFAKSQARNLTRLLGVRVRVSGTQDLGAGPYMFAPNHQSHFDIPLLLGFLPGLNRFVAKKELFREPVLGVVMRTMGMIPVDRDDPTAAIERLNRLADDPVSVIIFPEGGRSRTHDLLPFKKGAFVTAIQLGVPIVPVVCKGTREIMPAGGYLSIFPGEVELIVLKPIATSGMTYADRDRLRDLVRARIVAALEA